MSTIVIMPGGFHPFHAGHYALYQSAIKAFPGAEVYVAASDDTKTRPFPFAIKEKLAKVAGVAPGHFVQVKSPFRPEEITSQYDPEQDVLIFVRSEKDKTEQPKPGGTKKDGTPAYFQPYSKDQLQPFSKHAYIAYLPTVEFGPGITSATEIRNAWPKLDDRRKTAMVMSLYPATQKNQKLAANVVKMLDLGMGSEQQDVAEGSLNEFAPDGFNGGDDDEGFSPEIAKMAQEDGFTKGVSLADGATLARSITINHWHSQHSGMYKQYFVKGFKAGRMNKINHDNKQYNLNLKLMKDGSIRHSELNEYGDTAKGQKMLGKVHNRAADKVTSKQADKDPAYARKAQQTQDRAWDRLAVKEQGVSEGSRKSITSEQMISDAVEAYKQEAAKENPNTYILDSIKSNINDIKREIERNKQGVAEVADGWIGNPAKWKEAVLQAHGDDVVFKNYSHPGQPGKRSVNAINAAGKQVGVYQRHNKMGMVQPNMQGVAEADKHSVVGKIQRGHELKGKVDQTFKDIGTAQKQGDKEAGSNAFRKHERYANLERPGTWTKSKEQDVEEGSLNEFFSPGRDDDEGENPYDPLSFPEFKTMLALRLAGNTKGITVSRGSDSGMVKISINDRHRIVPLNIHGVAAAVKFIKQQGIAEGANDTIYPNAEVIKSKNGKPVGEIYQDGNSWGAFHYRADRGYDFIDSREEAIEALKDLHQETGRSRPNYTIKGVAESNVTESTDYLEEK